MYLIRIISVEDNARKKAAARTYLVIPTSKELNEFHYL